MSQLLSLMKNGYRPSESSLQNSDAIMYEGNELDGRDAVVKQHFKNRKDLVSEIHRAEDILANYVSNPWGPAFYNQFDDFLPKRIALHVDTPGKQKWELPITDVERREGVASWYDQVAIGTLEIVEVPASNGAASNFYVKIR